MVHKILLVNNKAKIDNQIDSYEYRLHSYRINVSSNPTNTGSVSNRFHTLSSLIRKIHDEYVFEKHTPPEWKDQLINLEKRIGVLKLSILFAAFGFLFNMLTVFGLYLQELFIARIIFGSCCLSMMISIIFFIIEIQISTKALRLHLSDMDIQFKE